MAINLATKYAGSAAERFSQQSITQGAFCDDFEFTGVATLKVYSVDTVPLGSYSRSGTARYGTPAELGDSVQELTMSQDKAFTFVIDKGNDAEQMNVKGAAKCLRREIDEQVTPAVDKYRLLKWAQNAGLGACLAAAPTKSTIMGFILDATAAMDNALVTPTGRKMFVKTSVYKVLKQADEFLSVEKIADRALRRGVVGEIDGMEVVKVPDSWMPADVYFMIVQKSACISPVKLQDYKLHKDPPGISGSLAEGRILYDAFVIGARQKGIYVAAASGKRCTEPTISPNGGAYTAGTTTVTLTAGSGEVIKYTLDGSDPKTSSTAQTYSSAIATTGWSGPVKLRCFASKSGLYDSGESSAVFA